MFAQDVEPLDVARTLDGFAKAEISKGAFDLFFRLVDFLNLRLCLIVSPIKLQSKLALDPGHGWRVAKLFELGLLSHILHVFFEGLCTRHLLDERVAERLDLLLRLLKGVAVSVDIVGQRLRSVELALLGSHDRARALARR